MDDATYLAVSEAQMPMFFRMAYSILRNRHDAEDAVQQALLNAWKSRDRARPGAERAWMTRIVINECRNIQRHRRRCLPMPDFPEEAAPSPSDPDTGLYDAIRALPEKLRTPFLLQYMEGMSEKETAATLGLPLSSVKNRLFRARNILKKTRHEEVAR